MNDTDKKIYHGYGKKIKQLRFFAGYTTQKEFADKHNFSLNTLQSLENERIRLSNKQASVLHDIFFSEGIKFDINWLRGNSAAQMDLGINSINIEDRDLIAKEIKFFSSLHKESVVYYNIDDSMLPFFSKGDYVGGIRVNILELEHKKGIYIVKAEEEPDLIIRKVEHEINDLFNLCTTNLNSDVMPSFSKRKKILDAFKIIWIRKNNNE